MQIYEHIHGSDSILLSNELWLFITGIMLTVELLLFAERKEEEQNTIYIEIEQKTEIMGQLIYLPDYDELENPNAYVDTSLSYDAQTDAAKQYIGNKTDAHELPILLNDGHNRPINREYLFEVGFVAVFKQNYKPEQPHWVIDSEVVTTLEIV